jgi:hypothetical protein
MTTENQQEANVKIQANHESAFIRFPEIPSWFLYVIAAVWVCGVFQIARWLWWLATHLRIELF